MTTVEFKFDLEQQEITLAGKKGVITSFFVDSGGHHYFVKTADGSIDYWHEHQLVLAD